MGDPAWNAWAVQFQAEQGVEAAMVGLTGDIWGFTTGWNSQVPGITAAHVKNLVGQINQEAPASWLVEDGKGNKDKYMGLKRDVIEGGVKLVLLQRIGSGETKNPADAKPSKGVIVLQFRSAVAIVVFHTIKAENLLRGNPNFGKAIAEAVNRGV